jgi:hypothetical protein
VKRSELRLLDEEPPRRFDKLKSLARRALARRNPPLQESNA